MKVGGLREDETLLFRAEFFNTFNHPQFEFSPSNDASLSNQDTSAATFGQITLVGESALDSVSAEVVVPEARWIG
jgi:hypothetical protein